MKEVELQNSIVTYLEYTGLLYTCTLGGIFLGKNNWKQKRMLARYYKKGVPDILIFEPSKLNARNYKAVVCRSLEEFIEIINAYKNEEI